jgi:archaemetzincin
MDIGTALQALGPLDGLDPRLRAAFLPGEDFELMKHARPGDWLAEQYEPGQTFRDFKNEKWNRPDAVRRKISLLPIESVPGWEVWPPLNSLKTFTRTYFSMEAEVLPTLSLRGIPVANRVNRQSGKIQLLTGDILKMLARRLPADSFCLLGISMDDLYPDPSWNFAFGEASLKGRIGVYSFARYDPAFYGDGISISREMPKLLLKRCCKVLAHETGHMFGLKHCIYFRCVMNGSNSMSESDKRPINLCPICLRKLHHSIGFEIMGRYRALADYFEDEEFDTEAQWVRTRLKSID